MHHALQIPEILYNIFDHYYPPDLTSRSHEEGAPDLLALATTCRAFKGPVLDVLWSMLRDLSPLARCIPSASRRLSGGTYSISRPLTQMEWDVFRSYACRVRTIWQFNTGLDWDSAEMFLNPPTAEPLFPNLRIVRHCHYTQQTMRLLSLPLPSLTDLDVTFEDPDLFRNSSDSFLNFSPNVREISISFLRNGGMSHKIKPNYMSRWKNLSSVVCLRITLDVDTLVHLSHMPALTRLSIVFNTTLPASHPVLVFSHLENWILECESLHQASRLLSQTQLPVITRFYVSISNCPSKPELSSFWTSFLTSNVTHTIQSLAVDQYLPSLNGLHRREARLLGVEDLRPCTAFNDLRHLELNLEWNVGLTDVHVLELAPALSRMEYLCINKDWGWNSRGGITPGGLVRLLRTWRSLRYLALCLDSRGYTEVPPDQAAESLGLALPRKFKIDVLDSAIEAESVPAVSAFLTGIAECTDSYHFCFYDWEGSRMIESPDRETYVTHWNDVYDRMDKALDELYLLGINDREI